MGRAGIRAAFMTGRGSIVMRARTHIEEIGSDREAIIVTEVPYQVNKARLLERIAMMVRDKQIEGISDLRDNRTEKASESLLNYAETPYPKSFWRSFSGIPSFKPALASILWR